MSTTTSFANRHGAGGMDKAVRDLSTHVEAAEGTQALSNILITTSTSWRRSTDFQGTNNCVADVSSPKSDNRRAVPRVPVLRNAPNGLRAHLDLLHSSEGATRRRSSRSPGKLRKSSLKHSSSNTHAVPAPLGMEKQV